MSSISKLVSTALTTFESLEHIADTHGPAQVESLRSSLTRFKLWAGSVGAHRPYGHRSLEYRLSGTSIIRGHFVTLLGDVCEHLQEADIVLRSDDKSSGDKSQQDDGVLSDYFADDEPDMDDFEQILLQLKNDVNCLMRLSVTIRNPAPHEQFKLRLPALVSPFNASHTEHVMHKFPRLQPEVADRLGRALANRRLYLRYREDHHARLKEGIEDEREVNEKEESRGGVTTEASWLPKDNPEDDDTRPRIWRDDISEQTGTSYAPSCLDDSELRIPPIPPDYVDGPFLCPYCRLHISIENRYQWKQHVFNDLQPYNCLEPVCPRAENGFVRRKDWFSHMVQEHWRTWTCPLECVGRFTTSSLFCEHMSQRHGSAITSPEAISGSREDLAQAKGKCPLCWEHEIVSSNQYRSHVGHHLEQLALFVLPRAEEVEEETEEEENEEQSEEEESEEQTGEEESEARFKLYFEKEVEELLKGLVEETKVNVAEEANESTDDDKEPIRFKDAVGRKFNFPWTLCATWASMEDLIKSAFEHVEVIGPHVQAGHYDLIGPDGEIIMPGVWEEIVQPGWNINMRMWPPDKHSLESRPAVLDMVDVVDGGRPAKKVRKARKSLGFSSGTKSSKKSSSKRGASAEYFGSHRTDNPELKNPLKEELNVKAKRDIRDTSEIHQKAKEGETTTEEDMWETE